MPLVRQLGGRRALALGLAGLMPAALVTLLYVHQPSIGDRRLYPMLRGPLAFTGLALALATLIAWAVSHDRLSRRPLSGLAWAGVTTILCVGPFVESTPRARLYALELESGDVVWTTARAAVHKVVDGDLVATDENGRLLQPDPDEDSISVVGGAVQAVDEDGSERWVRTFPGQVARAVESAGDAAYVY